MFIVDIYKQIKNKSAYYICSKPMSDILIRHGFSLLSINHDKDEYIYIKTKELMEFLDERW